MFCTYCGQEISDKAQYCHFCGASVFGAAGRNNGNCQAYSEDFFNEREKASALHRLIVILSGGYLSFNIVVLMAQWIMVSFVGVSKSVFLLPGLSGIVGIILLISIVMIYSRHKSSAQTVSEILFRYAITAIAGWIVNSLIIWVDHFVLGILGRRADYYYNVEYDIYAYYPRIPYLFLYLLGFVSLAGGIFLLRRKSSDKAHSVGKGVLGIILGAILGGECIILLFQHHYILGVVFLGNLVLSLLLGFCVHSVKIGVHIAYYVVAVFMNVVCTMFIHVEFIRGAVHPGWFTDSVAIIAPFTVLLPLISFGRGRFCPTLSDRNTRLGAERFDSTYQVKQPIASDAPIGSPKDSSSFGYAVLGFFVPMAGLVLYLVWRDTLPFRAKSVGKGALVATILNVVGGVVICVLYIVVVVKWFT